MICLPCRDAAADGTDHPTDCDCPCQHLHGLVPAATLAEARRARLQRQLDALTTASDDHSDT